MDWRAERCRSWEASISEEADGEVREKVGKKDGCKEECDECDDKDGWLSSMRM